MIEVGYAIGGEELGSQPCDGLICATPTGSTAYNLSNGGPVLVWGLDAMVLTFVAPHALDIRPLVVPRGPDVTITNLTPDLETSVLVDGQQIGMLGSGRPGDRPGRTAAEPARDPARGDVLPPVRRHLRPLANLDSARGANTARPTGPNGHRRRRRPSYDGSVLRRLRISNLVLDPRGGARARRPA